MCCNKNLLLSAIVSIGLAGIVTSCNEGSVGQSISQSSVSVVVDSLTSITGCSEEAISIPARTTQQLLGVVKAEDFGVLTSDFVTEFMPSNSLDTVGVKVTDIDSVKLFMRIAPMGFTGDSLVPMRTTVYPLIKQLPRKMNSNFDPIKEGYVDVNNVLGSQSYSATALGMGDSLYSEVYERQVAVTLPLSFGRELYTKFVEDPSTFQSPTAFAKWFPGVYVANSYGNGRVMHIQSTIMSIYYLKRIQNSAGNDTIYRCVGDYLATTPEVVNNNNIRLEMAQSVKDRVNAGEVIIQAPAGLNAKITLPIEYFVKKYFTAKGNNLAVMNNAYLKIPVEEIANSSTGFTPPPYLLLIKSSEKDTFFSENQITDNVTSYYAEYSEDDKAYIFSEMREYFKEIIAKGADYQITAEDCEFSLIPVSISTDTDYYSTEYVVGVTPYVDAPVMCKLNLNDVNFKVGFSVQQLETKQ